MNKNLDILILCGGSGTRLFPLSRKKLPKQFLNLTDKNKSMFQLTLERSLNIGFNKLWVVCNKEHNFLVKKELENLNIINYTIISEPIGKNTCAPIAVVSELTKSKNLLVISSDHIWDDEKFKLAVLKGLEIVENNIVTFGIKPKYPEIGYGYIKFNENNLIKFVEKPSENLAKEYLASGEYLWNSGNFLFDVEFMISQLKKYANDIYQQIKLTLEKSNITLDFILDDTEFSKVRDESIDFAVMENITNGKVICYDGYWNDIGSFKALHSQLDKDINNNVLEGDINALETTNCFIKSDKLVCSVGLENLAIIDTRDVLYIGDINKSQDVKKIVNELKKENREELIVHKKAYRPWGWYINVEGTDYSGFKVKRIGVYPGKRLSLQSHKKRSEHWVIVKGTAKVQVGEDQLILHKNQHVYIPVGVLHRMENIGENMVEFVETQIGDYLGEDDIIRYQDDFGRV